MRTSGVYAIYLTGTRYVYVGQSSNIEMRWRRHRAAWVWPNEAEYYIVRPMPKASAIKMQRTEAALMRLLRRKGYMVLGLPMDEANSLRIRKANSIRTPEQRKAVSQAARNAITQESLDRRSLTMQRRWENVTPEERLARCQKAWDTRRSRQREATA